ncbi:MAG: Flp/Fap pilin component [Alphaproteobacteria bacterium]|jgi:pilus assembly protein Flp/PilA|nr:Flp/Fap pilin component [Alphaproteobacteria bacterium]MEA3027634.1 Flp/Fap pilin component [Alphaproteobacteria bacterium]
MTKSTLNPTACRQLARFCADESGATAIEYAMVAAGVGGFIAATVMGMGAQLKSTFYDKLTSLFP